MSPRIAPAAASAAASPAPVPALGPAEAEALQRRQVAKLLGELAHERVLAPQPDGSGWVVADDRGLPRWRFRATRHALEHWRVDPASIRRLDEAGAPEHAVADAQQAVLDLRRTLGLTDRVLPLYLEELSATLLTTARRRALPAPSAAELAAAPLETVEQHLDEGHPGFVANSGRIGFGAGEQDAWAPEAAEPARLVWLAARRSLCVVSVAEGMTEAEHMAEHLLPVERERFEAAVRGCGEDPQEYTPIPVHPWQWEHRILPGMLPDVLRGDLIPAGTSEHRWRAQQSVRTFLDVEDTARDYAKTALGVHSMGFLRGLSPHYMRAMPAISDWLAGIVARDPELAAVTVLRERSSVGWLGDAHHRSGIRSEHTKQLAGLWRESPVGRLTADEHAASLAGVLHVDREGTPLVRAWIDRSGASPEEWVRALLTVYLRPVAHLLLSRSIALMPHGENVILRLRDGLPTGAFWKDLGEEIVVMDEQPLPEGLERLRSVIAPEQQELSVHTDVLDGVLRHLAPLLHVDGLLDEDRFWELAADVLRDHRDEHPHLWRRHDLLRESFEHSCLNRLQLRDPQQMVDLSDPAGSLAMAGRLGNPLAAAASRLETGRPA
ncbi:IucA/IucC family siderophore biosynthesis protein [Kocuria palustris]|uniref:IucA/IucC family protein n=1 Tax=Kocuria palustris TaxID=71999 RepID=UPI0011A8B924|nr:IucA/IucC family protein [Kocuria palustris]